MCFAGMMQYDGELQLPKHFLVPPPNIQHTTGEYLAREGVTTFACSESQKIGHVTFFWSGNRSGYFNADLEKYVEVTSSAASCLMTTNSNFIHLSSTCRFPQTRTFLSMKSPP